MEKLFKGINKDGKWIYGDRVTPTSARSFNRECANKYEFIISKCWVSGGRFSSNGVHWILKETLCRNTLKKDLNNNYIYENDIVEDEYGNKYVVKYIDVGSCDCCYTAFEGIGFAGVSIVEDENDYNYGSRCNLNKVKVIGNIFDKGTEYGDRK